MLNLSVVSENKVVLKTRHLERRTDRQTDRRVNPRLNVFVLGLKNKLLPQVHSLIVQGIQGMLFPVLDLCF